MDKWMIDPKEDIVSRELSPINISFVVVILFLFSLMYYAVKYSLYPSNDVNKHSTTNIKLYLANLLQGFQTTWTNGIQTLKEYGERVLFETHIINGVFHKTKTTDFLDSFISSSSFRKNE